ncbi:DUF4270 domain-containing protein [Flavobacterium sp. LS2P90]|uniref:DUF4270 domain-containing protein n=1 Tax=Flavobacterium xylosi TaxID=3230415 RepID=A0ABW6HTT6_9FLAO
MLVLASIILLYSCDKDYNAIGGDLIGDNHFDFSTYTSNVIAYNQKVGPVQSNDLAVNGLGIYTNPAFGTTTANFATQVSLSSLSPEIGMNPVIDSVYLDVPYFVDASKTKPNANGGSIYELDSIYGAIDAKIKLSVYESGYFMRDLDPAGGFQSAQRYYTNQNADFDGKKIGNRLNDGANTAQNDAFFFDPAQHVEITTDATGKITKTYVAPRMRLKLNKSFFDSKIIHAPAGKLATADVFKEYFRGLYFKVEKSGSNAGNLALLNFKLGKIIIKYKEDLSTTVGTVVTVTRVDKSIDLNMTGNSVSLLEQTNTNAVYSNATASPNTVDGDENLFVKGGEGSMAILGLFSTPGELTTLRSNGWLINEANLIFHIDSDKMKDVAGVKVFEPNRVYLYDLTNNRPVVDYFNDATTGTNPKNGKLLYGGSINKETSANGRGLTYKIRITNQIRNLIKNTDSTNVKLGLVVTEDINTVTSNYLKTPNSFTSQVPKANVMNPLGTILYGGKSTVPLDKRLKLEIFYTKPN